MSEFNIDLSKIKPNQIFNNYKALCKALNIIPAVGSKNIKNQKKKIACYLVYKKLPGSNKIIIIDIKQIPDEIIDKRKYGNHSKYCPDIIKLLANYIYELSIYDANNPNEMVYILLSDKEIMAITGLCNSKYLYKSYTDKLIKQGLVTRLDMFLFIQRHYKKSGEIITAALNQLTNHYKGLTYKKAFQLKEEEPNNIRVTTEEEYEMIKDINNKVLSSMNEKNMFFIFVKNKQDKFYEKVNEIVKEKINCTIIKELYIIDTPTYHFNNYQNRLEQEKKAEYLFKLNKKIIEYLDNNAIDLFRQRTEKEIFKKDDDLDKYNADLTKTEAYSNAKRKIYKLPIDYVEKQHIISKEFINIS
jgi:hypothetical protein